MGKNKDRKIVVDTLKSISTAVLIMIGLQLSIYAWINHWGFWAGLGGAIATLGGLDLRYGLVRVSATLKIEHKLDDMASRVMSSASIRQRVEDLDPDQPDDLKLTNDKERPF